jgi:phosphoribosylformylglycinamidine synthase
LDNFCWGNTGRPEQLGSLVRAALACHDLAIALGAPFISGKDSLNNEYHYENASGQRQTIVIPPTLLISAIGQIADARKAVTMDFKEAGNYVYMVGATYGELGGSHFAAVCPAIGTTGADPAYDHVPCVNSESAKRTFAAVHAALDGGLVRACHDLSEGGLAVAVAEMAFAGGFGARLELDLVVCDDSYSDAVRLFSESNTRFLCEVPPEKAAAFEQIFGRSVPCKRIGQILAQPRLTIVREERAVIEANITELKEAWQRPLRWE